MIQDPVSVKKFSFVSHQSATIDAIWLNVQLWYLKTGPCQSESWESGDRGFGLYLIYGWNVMRL